MASVQEGSDEFVRFCIQYSSLALLYYDYLLTFPLELQYMWRKRVMISTVLYWFCRYALVANLFYLLAISNVVNNCNGWYQFDGYLSIAGRASVLGVFAARTYAVWDRNKVVLFVMGVLWTTTIAFDFWHTTGDSCGGKSSVYTVISSTGLSILVCVFECVGTLLTTIRCLEAWKLHKKYGQPFATSNIHRFMLHEGSIYFFGVFGFTFTAAVLNFEAPMGFLGKLLNGLTLPISGIMSARLLLYLRQYNHRQQGWAMQHSHGSTSHVTMIADNHCDGGSGAPPHDGGSRALPEIDEMIESTDRVQSIFLSSNSNTYAEGEFGGDPVAGVRAGFSEMLMMDGEIREEAVSPQRLLRQEHDSLIITEEPRLREQAEMLQTNLERADVAH